MKVEGSLPRLDILHNEREQSLLEKWSPRSSRFGHLEEHYLLVASIQKQLIPCEGVTHN